jgi:glucose dehydrogenase
VGVPDRAVAADQIDADSGERHHLPHGPDNIWAIDARSARQLWRYTYPTNQGFHIGHRGAAVYKDSVYLTTPDAHLVALDAHTAR